MSNSLHARMHAVTADFSSSIQTLHQTKIWFNDAMGINIQKAHLSLATLAPPFALGVLGVRWLPSLPGHFASWVLLTCGLFAFFLLYSKRDNHFINAGKTWLILLALTALASGVGWASLRAEWRLAEALPNEWEGRDVVLTGYIDSLPQTFPLGQRFTFVIEEVSPTDAIVPRKVLLSWYREGPGLLGAAPPPLRVGERWRFTARLKRPHGNANPHGFDYEGWLLERNLRATGSVRGRKASERLAAFVTTPGTLIESVREQVRDRFLNQLPAPDYPFGGILTALAVGDQRAISSALWDRFARTGTTHLMSISGLHVTLIGSLIAILLNRVWRRSARLMLWLPARDGGLVCGWLAAGVYALLSGWGIPAQRTFFMLSLATLALLSRRQITAPTLLGLALLLVLLIDPWAVGAPGFWLSFAAVGILLYVALNAPTVIPSRPRWRQIISEWGMTQWAVSLGTLPLLLVFFQQFSLVSPLANALAIPLISGIVTPLALLAAALPLPQLLEINHSLLSLLMNWLEGLANWPVWQQAAPPFWTILLAMIGVMAMLLPKGVPGRFAGLALLLPALAWPPPRPAAGEVWAEILDVGQGLAVVVRTEKHTLIYDSGPSYSAESDAGQRIIAPYLRAIGVNRIDHLMISHRDSDHAGGVASLQAAFPITRITASWELDESAPCHAGQRWDWSGVEFQVLHPPPDASQTGSSNHRSCVLRISAGNQHLLLTGDIEARDEMALLRTQADKLAATVLVVPHHGSRTSSTPAFIAKVAPEAAIFTVGYRNRYKHPAPDIVARYQGIASWRSDEHGAISVQLGKQLVLSSWRQQAPRYWHTR